MKDALGHGSNPRGNAQAASELAQGNPKAGVAPIHTGMTQAKWDSMNQEQRNAARDNSSLSPQLVGLEGHRVEAKTTYGETRRFIVGKSTGWVPIHLELANRRSSGGGGAERNYTSVRSLGKVL